MDRANPLASPWSRHRPTATNTCCEAHSGPPSRSLVDVLSGRAGTRKVLLDYPTAYRPEVVRERQGGERTARPDCRAWDCAPCPAPPGNPPGWREPSRYT